MYCGNGRTVEMTTKNTRGLTFSKRYAGRKIKITRFPWVDAQDRRRLKAEAKKMSGMKFDRLRVIVPLLPRLRKNSFFCTEFIDRIYLRATGITISTERMMRNQLNFFTSGAEVIYDYRKDKQWNRPKKNS